MPTTAKSFLEVYRVNRLALFVIRGAIVLRNTLASIIRSRQNHLIEKGAIACYFRERLRKTNVPHAVCN